MQAAHDLERFVEAQRPFYAGVLSQLKKGRKTDHWMWFVFPQVAGLGRSDDSRRYAIRSCKEARAYMAHPVLGRRLRECTELVLGVEGHSAEGIFGYPDYLKFRSCMTLFTECIEDIDVFRAALQKYFQGEPDPRTLDYLRQRSPDGGGPG